MVMHFFLGDTGWLLFSKLNREEAQKYRENRAEKDSIYFRLWFNMNKKWLSI